MALKLTHRQKLAIDAAERKRDEMRALRNTLYAELLDSTTDDLERAAAQDVLRFVVKVLMLAPSIIYSDLLLLF